MDFNNPFRSGNSLLDAVKSVFEKNEKIDEQKPLEPVKVGKKKDKVDTTPSMEPVKEAKKDEPKKPELPADLKVGEKRKTATGELQRVSQNVIRHTRTKYAAESVDYTEIDLTEGTVDDLYLKHHNRIKELLKGISKGLDAHAKNSGNARRHYGHVGDVAHIANQLSDIHDGLHMKGEYAKPISVKEEVEQVEEKLAHPNHKKLDVAEPKGKLTAADFKALRAGKKPVEEKKDVEPSEDESKAAYDKLNNPAVEKEGKKNLHNCATSVYSEQWGNGKPIKTMHAEPDEAGNIAWYDVMFDHGIEKQVPVTEMKILASEAHENHKKK